MIEVTDTISNSNKKFKSFNEIQWRQGDSEKDNETFHNEEFSKSNQSTVETKFSLIDINR